MLRFTDGARYLWCVGFRLRRGERSRSRRLGSHISAVIPSSPRGRHEHTPPGTTALQPKHSGARVAGHNVGFNWSPAPSKSNNVPKKRQFGPRTGAKTNKMGIRCYFERRGEALQSPKNSKKLLLKYPCVVSVSTTLGKPDLKQKGLQR